jgi:hypothetical protein
MFNFVYLCFFQNIKEKCQIVIVIHYYYTIENKTWQHEWKLKDRRPKTAWGRTVETERHKLGMNSWGRTNRVSGSYGYEEDR